ncbi:MAG: hypothetical protein DIZ78_10115 [endosymbiont of Escarpia spicata]|uniref:Uncharacterized protein n=1 Tax=endosymbiont of Escarpia spicata TaxID=2200908 RepID=A0A370DLL8_9GAMM|nr:MAG: hypothetical protein DIZ78_10115 [endosymbiont of Escarpia spicata]
MKRGYLSRFLKGFLLGMSITLSIGGLLLWLLSTQNLVTISVESLAGLQNLLSWSSRNMGMAVWPFTLVLLLFLLSLRTLRQRITAGQSIDRIVQAAHLTDIWIGLFFGIGVIWTAIGMRSALLFALGDPETAAQLGAFVILQRLVDGGILLALSTTIFGGIGGYLMRVIKAVAVGGELQRYYSHLAEQHNTAVQSSLDRIDSHLQQISHHQENRDEPLALTNLQR